MPLNIAGLELSTSSKTEIEREKKGRCIKAAFGPKNAYFYSSPDQRSYSLSGEVRQRLKDEYLPDSQVGAFALGPHGVYYMSITSGGRNVGQAQHYGPAKFPTELQDWLGPQGTPNPERDLESIRVAFTNDGGYFATDKNGVSHNDKIPPLLQIKIEESFAEDAGYPTPLERLVAFGTEESYFVMLPMGLVSFDLMGCSEVLHDALAQISQTRPAFFRSILHFAMSPFQKNCWFMVSRDGQCFGTLPEHWDKTKGVVTASIRDNLKETADDKKEGGGIKKALFGAGNKTDSDPKETEKCWLMIESIGLTSWKPVEHGT